MSTNGYPFPMTFTFSEIPRIDIFVISYPPSKHRIMLSLMLDSTDAYYTASYNVFGFFSISVYLDTQYYCSMFLKNPSSLRVTIFAQVQKAYGSTARRH